MTDKEWMDIRRALTFDRDGDEDSADGTMNDVNKMLRTIEM